MSIRGTQLRQAGPGYKQVPPSNTAVFLLTPLSFPLPSEKEYYYSAHVSGDSLRLRNGKQIAI